MHDVVEPSGSLAVRQSSLTNPTGVHEHDVPSLLRRVADALDALGPVEVVDILFRPEQDVDGRPEVVVRYHPTVSFDDVRDLFEPFLQDAVATAGVRFTVENGGADDSSVYVVVRAPDGTADGFSFDRQGRDDDSALRALECFDVLQETVHHVRARQGRIGPWPSCPLGGHAHRLVAAWDPDTSSGWWDCPGGGHVVPIGGLG